MPNAVVVVADAARARGFRLTDSQTPREEFSIEEELDLVRPESRVKEGDRFSASTPTGNRGRIGPAHTFDDHRERNDLEHRKLFAQSVAKDIASWVLRVKPGQLIVAASHSIRSLLQEALSRGPLKRAPIRWVTGEFTQLTAPQLQHELVQRHLV